ncbi:MAG: tRNA (cytidine(34)-2'-O)-methyltransferase [Deferribacteraceae bacterium]|jgi:tRNA (cytidine/uridine-2'-O-)-methyltransferase|nr:tRNA (cytidine(34)-2'-O)-methyltransferase [Deferribacteraceae bacterium]
MLSRIVLLEPEIPQNTGNIGRLASALGLELWLVGRLGFSITDKQIRRSGMDYWSKVAVRHIATLDEYYPLITPSAAFISTKGVKPYTDIKDTTELVFGSESSGLPAIIYEQYPNNLYRIPMKEGIRSINVSSSVAAVAYHITATTGFIGLV